MSRVYEPEGAWNKSRVTENAEWYFIDEAGAHFLLPLD